MAGNDRRFSSYAREIDAAIERVVTHFEDNDVALRLDVLRGLAAHAKLAFESERVKQRLLQHPVAKDLVERVATRSSVFARLQRALAVEEFSCDYDRQRNVEMRALVRWTLPPAEEAKKPQTAKKLKTVGKRRARDERPLYMRYTFTRTTHEGAGEGEDDEEEKAAAETIVTYSVAAGVGVDAEMKELVRYELASDSAYPRSFYEEDQAMESDEEDGGEEEQKDEEEEPAAENDPSENGDEDDEKSQQEGGEKDEFGEEVRGFDFDDTVMDAILEWLSADEDEIDPADVIGFFLALPMYEDDWTIDERVCQILFNGGPGGDSEMEEEVVSDFDDEDGGDAGSDEDEDVEVADLD